MRRILAIGAHPDDVELGCGGLLQHSAERRIVVLSRGESGGDAETRVLEAQCSAELLRATCRVEPLVDTAIELGDAIKVLEAEVTSYEPNMVLTMAADDTHQDHRTLYLATAVACRNAPCTILAYLGPSSALAFRPNWFAHLTKAQMDLKLAALACHASQAARTYTQREYVEGMGRYWAMVTRSSAAYVEPYELVRYLEP